MDETLQYIYAEVIERFLPEYISSIEFEYTPWVFSIIGAALIGLSGILPLLVIPIDAEGKDFKDRKCRRATFRYLWLWHCSTTNTDANWAHIYGTIPCNYCLIASGS